MKSIAEIRRQNLAKLVDKHGLSNVAKRVNRSATQISDTVAGRKSFGEKLARAIEKEWDSGLQQGWLDVDKEAQSLEGYEYAGRVPKAILLPVAGIAQLGENGWYDEIEANGTEGYVEHHSRDADAYALRVRGDSMYPAIRNGWYVVAEPNGALAPGEYAAVALADGRKMVKELLFESENEITLQSVNGGQRISVARSDIVSIHPVAAVVSPSKHRE